jgi:hypothetical protein
MTKLELKLGLRLMKLGSSGATNKTESFQPCPKGYIMDYSIPSPLVHMLVCHIYVEALPRGLKR